VDVTAAVIRAEFASAGIVAADQLPAAKLIVISQPPFWQLEERGLQNFRSRHRRRHATHTCC